MDSIDVDDNVLAAIFRDDFPESWQTDHNFVQYLAELSSYGVEKLAQEPDRLAEEKAQILQETQNLAFQNYRTFIQTAECSREIFEDFQIIEQHVEDLLGKLPVFSEQCNLVLKKAQEISSSRRMNTLTLQRHTQLLEILEVPQLMDTCVRNSYYDEALELASYVKRLEKKHTAIPVINNIVNEVKQSAQLMLNQLIQQLRTNIQLPACLRVIGYLRRMDVFTEVELRMKFLQARDTWFLGILEAIPKEDAYTHIIKTIEASRVNLFDITTQYRAIFSDEDPLLSTSKQEWVGEGALFHTWIVQKVSQFLATLEADLKCGVGGRLDSILGQCMYFGLSFSRISADFRGLLIPIFQQAALSGFQLGVNEANKRFEDNMRSYNLLSTTSGMGGLPYSPFNQAGQLYPPTILLDFHPLAAYCNDILNAFNDLRLCAPIALVTSVCSVLFNSFILINKVILAFHRAEETTFDHKEKERFDKFCTVYAHSLVPYINKCLQCLYPPAQLAQVLGITLSELHKMGNMGQIDQKSAMETIAHLIPKVDADVLIGATLEQDDDSVMKSKPLAQNQADEISQPALKTLSQTDHTDLHDKNMTDQPVVSSQVQDQIDQSMTGLQVQDQIDQSVTGLQVQDQIDQSMIDLQFQNQATQAEYQSHTENSSQFQTNHIDACSHEEIQNIPTETNSSLETSKTISDENGANSEGILNSRQVLFSLSDTEDEINLDDIGKGLGADSLDNVVENDTDLSALAADVFGKKDLEMNN